MNKKLYSLYEYLKQNNLYSEASGVYNLYKSADGSDDCFVISKGEACLKSTPLLVGGQYKIDTVTEKSFLGATRKVHLAPTYIKIGAQGAGDEKSSPMVSVVHDLGDKFNVELKFGRGDDTSKEIKNICASQTFGIAEYKGGEDIQKAILDSMTELLTKNQDLAMYISGLDETSFSCNEGLEAVSATYTFIPKSNLKGHKLCICLKGDYNSVIATINKHPDNPELPPEAVVVVEHDDDGVEAKDELTQDQTVDDDMEGIIALSDGVMIKAGCPANNDNCVDPLFNIDVDELYELYIGVDNMSYRNQYIKNKDGVLERRNQNYIKSPLKRQQPMDILTGNSFRAKRDLIIRALIESKDKKPTMLMRQKQDYFNKEFSEYIWKQMLIVAEGGGGGYVTVNGVKGIKKIQSSGGNILHYFKDYIFEYFLKKYSELPGKKREVSNWLAEWHVQQAARFGPLREIKAPTLESLPD